MIPDGNIGTISRELLKDYIDKCLEKSLKEYLQIYLKRTMAIFFGNL